MTHRKSAWLVMASIMAATCALAQTPQPPPDTTSPSGASTQHQREVTGSKHDQSMKDCMKKEHEKNASLSKDQLKKTCQDQMKTHSSDQMKKY